jgi:hypothetical protein
MATRQFSIIRSQVKRMNMDRWSLSQMYDRLQNLQSMPQTPEVSWEIADVCEAIEQTINGTV